MKNCNTVYKCTKKFLFELSTWLYIVVAMAVAYIQAVPVTWHWFSAAITVPNYVTGAKTVGVKFERVVKRRIVQTWTMDISAKRVNGKHEAKHCESSGVRVYHQTPLTGLSSMMNLNDLVGVRCDLGPGTYKLTACWYFDVWFIQKNLCVNSNVFDVTASN